jgi:hypothetical protein
MHAQPLIAVRDVQASSRWYRTVLNCQSGHGGTEYERILDDGRLILQLHHWDAHEHPHIGIRTCDPTETVCFSGSRPTTSMKRSSKQGR